MGISGLNQEADTGSLEGRGVVDEKMLCVFFDDVSNGCLVELNHGAIGDFDHHGFFFKVVNEAMDASGGDNFIACLHGIDALLQFFALALLWADEQEVEHHDHRSHHQEL